MRDLCRILAVAALRGGAVHSRESKGNAVPTNRAKQLRQQSTELRKQCTETVLRSELIVKRSRTLQRQLIVRAKTYAAGAGTR